MWLNICLLPCGIYMSKLTHVPFPSPSSADTFNPFVATHCVCLISHCQPVAICISLFNYARVMYALCHRIYLWTYTHTHTHSDPPRYVFHFRKTMKIVCARCKVNKVNAFIVQQCQFLCVGYTLIARIALETYWQTTIYTKRI